MKFICIDIGNTRTKVGFFTNEQLDDVLIIEEISVETINSWLKQFPDATCILSSTQKYNSQIVLALQKFTKFILLDAQTPVPFQNAYHSPQTLGLDRIALVAAAVSLFPHQNTLVIDAGTCITLDFIDETSTYQGGSIHPGISMRIKAMHNFTGKLPLVETVSVDFLLGVDTKSCLQSGGILGAGMEIDAFISVYRARYPGCKVLLTGGDQDIFFSMLKNEIFALPNLVLKGLQKIAQHNV